MTEQGVDFMLVGDSLGNVGPQFVHSVRHGHHTECAPRHPKPSLLAICRSRLTYSTPEQTYDNAAALMQAGANMKLEAGNGWKKPLKGYILAEFRSVHTLVYCRSQSMCWAATKYR